MLTIVMIAGTILLGILLCDLTDDFMADISRQDITMKIRLKPVTDAETLWYIKDYDIFFRNTEGA